MPKQSKHTGFPNKEDDVNVQQSTALEQVSMIISQAHNTNLHCGRPRPSWRSQSPQRLRTWPLCQHQQLWWGPGRSSRTATITARARAKSTGEELLTLAVAVFASCGNGNGVPVASTAECLWLELQWVADDSEGFCVTYKGGRDLEGKVRDTCMLAATTGQAGTSGCARAYTLNLHTGQRLYQPSITCVQVRCQGQATCAWHAWSNTGKQSQRHVVTNMLVGMAHVIQWAQRAGLV